MAAARKSASQVDARRQARERAAQFREREESLEKYAVDYIVNQERIAKTETKLEEDIAALRAKAAADVESDRHDSKLTILAMVGMDVSKSEVAARLGVTAKVVRDAVAVGDDQGPYTATAGEGADARTFGDDSN